MRLGLPLLLASIALAVPAVAQTASAGSKPIRFTRPVCPGVYGLARQQAALITGRMRQVAKAAGVPLANQPCDPNAIVIVATNKAATIEALQQKHADYFPHEWSDRQIRALEADSYPAAAWQFEGLLTPDGIRVAENSDPSQLDPVNTGSLAATATGTTLPASRMRPSIRRDVMTSVLVVEAKAIAGITTTQFADYAAMRTFARADPRQTSLSASDTILKVLDAPMGTAVPLSVTAQDLDFLKAYYSR
jgi:hypothetical protein